MNRIATLPLTKKERFYQLAYQSAFFLDTEVEYLADYLARRNWLDGGEVVRDAKIAGQGNMNYIVRVTTSARTFIVKQSRPWVEKYPGIAAPFDRALIEAEFYSLVSGTSAAELMPKLHWVDPDSRILFEMALGLFGPTLVWLLLFSTRGRRYRDIP